MVDENALLTAAREGENFAFEELYMRNKEKIAGLVYRCVGNRQDAEDLLQEIFIKAFLSIKKFEPRPGASFSSYLYRRGINSSINFLKKRKRHDSYNHETEAGEINPVTMGRGNTNPEQASLKQETRENLQVGLDSLSPQQKMVFVLKHFQGLRVAEIARYMGCGEGSIRKQLFRAVCRLREKLNIIYAGAKNEM